MLWGKNRLFCPQSKQFELELLHPSLTRNPKWNESVSFYPSWSLTQPLQSSNQPLLTSLNDVNGHKVRGDDRQKLWLIWRKRKKVKNKIKSNIHRGDAMFRSCILQTLYRVILNWPGSMDSIERRNSKENSIRLLSTDHFCTSQRKFIHLVCLSQLHFFFIFCCFLQSSLVCQKEVKL